MKREVQVLEQVLSDCAAQAKSIFGIGQDMLKASVAEELFRILCDDDVQQVDAYDFLQNTTALHEAAHAVVALHEGIDFRYVTVRQNRTSLGHITTSPTPRRMSFERARSEASVCMAGMIAERFVNDDDWPPGCEGDLLDALEIMDKREDLSISMVAEYTEDIVFQGWENIVVVAGALLDLRRLSYGQVKALLEVPV